MRKMRSLGLLLMTDVMVNSVSNRLSEIPVKERIGTWSRDLCLFSICNALPGIVLSCILCLHCQVSCISLLKPKLVKFPNVSSPIVSGVPGCWYILNYFNSSQSSFLCCVDLELIESWVKPWLNSPVVLLTCSSQTADRQGLCLFSAYCLLSYAVLGWSVRCAQAARDDFSWGP